MFTKKNKRIIAIICVICMVAAALLACIAPVMQVNAQDLNSTVTTASQSSFLTTLGIDNFGLCLLCALILSTITTGMLISQLKTVHKHNEATPYSVNGIELMTEKDCFIRKNLEKKRVR